MGLIVGSKGYVASWLGIDRPRGAFFRTCLRGSVPRWLLTDFLVFGRSLQPAVESMDVCILIQDLGGLCSDSIWQCVTRQQDIDTVASASPVLTESGLERPHPLMKTRPICDSLRKKHSRSWNYVQAKKT